MQISVLKNVCGMEKFSRREQHTGDVLRGKSVHVTVRVSTSDLVCNGPWWGRLGQGLAGLMVKSLEVSVSLPILFYDQSLVLRVFCCCCFFNVKNTLSSPKSVFI